MPDSIVDKPEKRRNKTKKTINFFFDTEIQCENDYFFFLIQIVAAMNHCEFLCEKLSPVATVLKRSRTHLSTEHFQSDSSSAVRFVKRYICF